MLALWVHGARLMPNSTSDRSADAIGDLPARTDSIFRDDGDAGPRHVLVPAVQPAELRALGFDEPELSDHQLTGQTVLLDLGGVMAPRQFVVGHVFSIDASGSEASMRALITPVQPLASAPPYFPLSTVVAAAAAAQMPGAPGGAAADGAGDAGGLSARFIS